MTQQKLSANKFLMLNENKLYRSSHKPGADPRCKASGQGALSCHYASSCSLLPSAVFHPRNVVNLVTGCTRNPGYQPQVRNHCENCFGSNSGSLVTRFQCKTKPTKSRNCCSASKTSP